MDTVRKTVYLGIGPVGCGKGTQFGLLEERYGIKKIVMSDLLIARSKDGDETGLLIKKTMDKGDLVPDPIVIEVLRQFLLSLDCDRFSLDGFPRSLIQAKAIVEELGRDFDIIPVLIEVDDETSDKQIANRLKLALEENERRMRAGLEPLVIRADDQPEIRSERLKLYRKSEHGMVDYFDNNVPGKTRRIPGMARIEIVHDWIVDELGLLASE